MWNAVINVRLLLRHQCTPVGSRSLAITYSELCLSWNFNDFFLVYCLFSFQIILSSFVFFLTHSSFLKQINKAGCWWPYHFRAIARHIWYQWNRNLRFIKYVLIDARYGERNVVKRPNRNENKVQVMGMSIFSSNLYRSNSKILIATSVFNFYINLPVLN